VIWPEKGKSGPLEIKGLSRFFPFLPSFSSLKEERDIRKRREIKNKEYIREKEQTKKKGKKGTFFIFQ
jgi:hypothetical protein